MTTMSAPAPEAIPLVDRDASRIVLEGLSWQTFLRILDETGDHRRTRLAFNRGVLELMSPGPLHEEGSSGFDALLKVLCEEAEIDFKSYGSTIWKRDNVERGIEADRCYYFAREKIEAAGIAARRRSNDSADYPIPDLAIEIDLRRSALDRGEIYASLSVPEVWSFEHEQLHIFQLGDDQAYLEVNASRFIPLDPAEMTHWVGEFERQDNERLWTREFREWVRRRLGRPG